MKKKLTTLSLIASLALFGAACDADADVDADVPEVDVPEVPEGPDIDVEGGVEGEADG